MGRHTPIHQKRRGGTQLTDLTIDSLEDANYMVGVYTASGETPVVLYPRPTSFQWKFSVPEGFKGLRYKSGAFQEVVDPGKYVLGVNEHIKTLVSTAHTIFDVPVKEITTKDNATVSVDMCLVFKISDVALFQNQTNCSAAHLHTILTTSQQDAARGLMRSYLLDEVYDLSGDSSVDLDDPDSEDHVREMMDSINEALNKNGVEVVSLTLTKIEICDANIRNDIANTAAFPIREEKEQVALKFAMLGEEHGKEMAALKQELSAVLVSQKDAADASEIEVQREIDLLREDVKRAQQSFTAEKNVAILELKAQTDKTIMELEGQLSTFLTSENAKIDAEVQELVAESNAYSRELSAKGEFAFAEKRAEIVALDVKAEKMASDLLMQRREFELAQKKLNILELLAGQERLLVSADSGIIARGETGGVIPFLREKRIVSRLESQSNSRRSGTLSSAVVAKGVSLVEGTQK